MDNWGGRLGTFDLETTGVDTRSSRIVSACVAVLDDGGLVTERRDWLADPGIPIPPQAAAVHGITTERAQAEGRIAMEVVAEITETLRLLFDAGVPVVVYNAPYDLSLLAAECQRYGIPPIEAPAPVFDPLVIDQAVDRYRKGKRVLELTAAFYGVPLDDAHDAGSDAIAAARVALALGAKYPEQLDIDPLELHRLQVGWFADRAADYESWRRSQGDSAFHAPREWPLRPLRATTGVA